MSEGEIDVKFGASIEGLKSGIEEAKEKLEGLTEPIAGIVDSFKELGEAILVALAFEKVAEFAEKMGELGEATERTSKILGISTEQVGQLNFAAAMTGTSTESLSMTIGRFEAGLAQAATGTGRMAEGLKALGLSAKELQGVPVDKMLERVAEATSRFADGANKTAALSALGRGFVELIPLLDEGAKGFEELHKKASESGSSLDKEMTERLVDMQHGMVNLKETIVGLTIGAFAPFINVVNGAVAILTDIAHTLMESAKEGGELNSVLKGVANAFQNLEQFIGETILVLKDFYIAGDTAANVVGEAFRGLGAVVSDVFAALGRALPEFFKALVTAGAEAVKAVEQQFIDLGTVIGDTMKLNFSGAKEAFGAMGSDASASAAKISGAFKGVFDFSAASEDQKKSIDRMAEIMAEGDKRIVENAKVAQQEYNRIWGVKSEGEKKPEPDAQVPNMKAPGKKGGKDTSARDAAEEAATEIKIWDDQAKLKQQLLDHELKDKQINIAQWLAGTKDALQDELQDTIETYQQELQVASLTAQQRKVINDKMVEAIAANAVKVQAAELKAADVSVKTWDDATKTINSAFSSEVDGLLKGTESFSTAMKNVLVSLTQDVLKFFLEWGLKAAENAALQLAAQNSVTAGMVTALGLQGAAQATAAKPGILASITADVGQAFAGFTAFLAPVLGPAAPAAAAGLASGVQATATGMAAADIGIYDVPGDMPALIHREELVMPAPQASAFRDMLSGKSNGQGGASGGDTHVHFNVSAMDAPGVKGWIDDNAHHIANAVRQSINGGGSGAMQMLNGR